jgi:pimeloyl-ACP methyl ester carboxylesterase
MDAISTNTRQVTSPGNSEAESKTGNQSVNELKLKTQQLAEIRENAKSSLPSSIPLQPMQQTPSTSTASSSVIATSSTAIQIAEIPVHLENVELDNHVSMQIFNSPMLQSGNKVVMFLHGGPGLIYNEGYQPVTDYFVGHGYTLVAPEIAGSGKPGLKNASNSYTGNYVRDLKAVIHALRERPDMQGKEVSVVAHSWGGFQLASLMTDESLGEEDRQFFKKAIFIAANLDSAQTRFFSDTANYNDQSHPALLASMHGITEGFKERHLGHNEELPEFEKMTETNNPLIDQSLNEKFSPFYRLEQMPLETPCLFVHAADDKSVPVSQSVDAFERIRNAGGKAGIVINSEGGHGFFKAGKEHRSQTMANCFGAIDNFIRQPGSANTAMIDDTPLPEAGASRIEEKLKEKVETYENAARC